MNKNLNNGISISSSLNNIIFDVVFNHPDDDSLFGVCAINYDDYSDYDYDYDTDTMIQKSNDDFMLQICKTIWDEYNSSYYYHDMIITEHHIMGNELHYIETSYNGYEITSKRVIKKTII